MTMHTLEAVKTAFEAEFPDIEFRFLPPTADVAFPAVLTNSHPSGVPLSVVVVDRPLDVALADFRGSWDAGPPAELVAA